MLKLLQKEYWKIMNSLQLREEDMDYSVAARHISRLRETPYFIGSAVSVFDNAGRRHIYESEYHRKLFCDADGVYRGMKIHPDDMEWLMKNAIATMRHIFTRNSASTYSKLIREYRVSVKGQYRRIIEEIQILEFSGNGSPWLALSIINVSPDQNPPFNVLSRLVNTNTGDVFTPLDEYYDRDCVLSKREMDVLSMIARGLLSKEIAYMLNISVNTVNNHRQSILRKLKVDNSMEAVKYAMTLGLLNGL